MPSPLSLPRLAWGDPAAERSALLVHGLGSNGALMWRYGTALADAGWRAVAVDLRGHGTAPRALDYTIEAYASDVARTLPEGAGTWDLVLGHSLGAAAATVAAAHLPEWTRRLVLVDPAIMLTDRDRAAVREGLESAFDDSSLDAVTAAHPHWHPQDVELKAQATREASRWAVKQTSEQNAPWDVRAEAARLEVPTHVIAADPAVHSLFTGGLADEVLGNPRITMEVIAGAGHSVHRDRPEQATAALLAALA
ncbi:alpha/beta fold hydrolase [Microbacterium sp. P04]|uniref:alpha/beta fold hydrolase n=1 Tax=Microbacterium sp. P04 TaxID=3366947 RepID=UPI0037476CC3